MNYYQYKKFEMTEKPIIKKTAVVFGGTGLVGRELINQLIGREDYENIIAVLRIPLPFSDTKLEQLILPDFSHLLQLKGELKATDYFCCIGTTIKKAGSQEAFRLVDFGIPKDIASLAESLSVTNFVLISSIGADASSSNFYLRTKGEMENTVRDLYSGNLKIVRPSLLMGKRKEYRFGENFAEFFMTILGWLFCGPLSKYRGIYARDVANAMIIISGDPSDKVVFETNELRAAIKRKKLP